MIPFSFIKNQWDADALAYFYRASIFDMTERLAVNTLFKTLKATPAIWTSLQGGFLYLVSPTNFTASLYNSINNSFILTSLTAGGYPDYSTSGWSFNGATNYLNTNYNCQTQMTPDPPNTGFMYIYNKTNLQSAGFPLGAAETASNQWQIQLRNASNQCRFSAYNGTSVMSVSNTDSSGHFVFSITASNSRFIRRNGVSLGTSAATVGGTMPNYNMYIGCRNSSGSTSDFIATQIASVANGTVGLSTTNADIFYNAMATYNATVISGGR